MNSKYVVGPGPAQESHSKKTVGALASGAMATGAIAAGGFVLGALAMGAVAIGAVAIGRLVVGRARIRKLEIDELSVRRLNIIEELRTPPPKVGDRGPQQDFKPEVGPAPTSDSPSR